MAKFDLAKITEPVSDAEPCGPDLDMAFDDAFMALVADLDGNIPASFFTFQPGSFDFAGYEQRIGAELERTRDLRLLVPLAKVRILAGDLIGFAAALSAIHRLLAERWPDVHPQPMDGSCEFRNAHLSTLDDLPNVVLPLAHAALFQNRRHGVVSFRRWQIASGAVTPRDGEEKPEASAITQATTEAEPEERRRVLDALKAAQAAVAGIFKAGLEGGGYEHAVKLERLPKMLEDMLAFVIAHGGDSESADQSAGEGAAAGEDGAPAGEGGQVFQTVVLPPGAVGSRAEVRQALMVIGRYYAEFEPSSPVELLIREAIANLDKPFHALVTDLMPASAGQAALKIGRDPFFVIPLGELATRNPPPDYGTEAEAAEAAESAGLEGDDEEAISEPIGPGGTASDGPEAEGGAALPSSDESGPTVTEITAEEPDPVQVAAAAAVAPEAPRDPQPGSVPAGPKFWARSRPEAVALMQKVTAYYKVAEPSSPVPLILERAIELSAKGFMDLLSDVLPEGSLSTPKK